VFFLVKLKLCFGTVIVLNYVFVWLDGDFRFYDSVVGLYLFSFFLPQHYTDFVLCLNVEPLLVGNEHLISICISTFIIFYFVGYHRCKSYFIYLFLHLLLLP